CHAPGQCSGSRCHLLMAPCRRRTSSTELLSLRSTGSLQAGTLSRLNMRILRGVILQDSRNFIKVWSKTSKSSIAYENGKIYFENYQNCYSCVHSQPQVLYKLPKRSKLEKIEDALLCQNCGVQNILLVLTANNFLYRLSAETGEELQRVYLSPHHKFRYLGWDVSQEIFYVKSIQNKATSLARQAGITQDTLMHLAIFHVFPLQIVGIMEISKKVFGNGVTDVVLSQGVLAVSYSSKSVKLYSFEHIVNKYMTKKFALGQKSSLHGGKTVGEAPLGIPVNIHFSDCPPVLFEVSCSDNSVQIGGYPWHYIYTPPHKYHKGTHHICSLVDSVLATNGIQDMKCCSLETDWISFHPDDSGRIIHVGPKWFPKLLIHGSGFHRQQAASQVSVTSSGRTVKRRFDLLDDDPEHETFRMVEYEDELDLLAVVVTEGEGEGRAEVRLHDNKSGKLLRKLHLVEPWDETFRHELFFDKDTIVHIEQKNNNFCCHVYKLQATRK
uniref:Ddb1 and cul4 associated factor 17 n=1 Tax=Myripristis murdjan TaxID=586833 RepID=A0A667YPW0_9TELE